MNVRIFGRESGDLYLHFNDVDRIATRINPIDEDDVQVLVYSNNIGHPYSFRYFDFVIEK